MANIKKVIAKTAYFIINGDTYSDSINFGPYNTEEAALADINENYIEDHDFSDGDWYMVKVCSRIAVKTNLSTEDAEFYFRD